MRINLPICDFAKCRDNDDHNCVSSRAQHERCEYMYFKDKHDAIPVKHKETAVGSYCCPTCDASFVAGWGTTLYCGNCGQRLDWGDENE